MVRLGLGKRGYRLAKRDDGTCAFLTAEGRCRSGSASISRWHVSWPKSGRASFGSLSDKVASNMHCVGASKRRTKQMGFQ